MPIDPRLAERNKAIRESWKQHMETDFDPQYLPEHTPKAEDRMIKAVEYAAYQLGQINRRLGTLIELLGSDAAKK